jgi:hypothetical protein
MSGLRPAARRAALAKKMLIDAVIHRCLERSLAIGKIIRIFNTLEIAEEDQIKLFFQ